MRLPLGEKCQPAPANLRSDCMSMNAIITAMVIIVGSIATVLMLYLTVLEYRDQARDPEPKTHPPHSYFPVPILTSSRLFSTPPALGTAGNVMSRRLPCGNSPSPCLPHLIGLWVSCLFFGFLVLVSWFFFLFGFF